MARARMIKPAFFKHAELYEAERESGLPLRLAFAGLWTVADKEGRFRWKIDLKPDILPYDPVDMLDVLNSLERHGFVKRYVVDGKAYGYIPSFKDHQTPHHTERASSIPSPLGHGESTVTLQDKTDTDAVTDTDTVVDDRPSIPSEPELTTIYLAICANGAIAERWGESPNPLTPATAVSTVEELTRLGVPPEAARLSIYRQCRESKLNRAPFSVAYFCPGIIADWQAEKMREAGTGERAPPRERQRNGQGRATMLLAQIRELVQEHQQPGQAMRRFIPKAKVAALGDDVLRAYEAVGGSERVLGASGEQMGFLLRDFAAALEETRATA